MGFIREFRDVLDGVCGDDLMEEQRTEVGVRVRFVY